MQCQPQRKHQPLMLSLKNPRRPTRARSYQVGLVQGLLPVVELLLQVTFLPAEQVLKKRRRQAQENPPPRGSLEPSYAPVLEGQSPELRTLRGEGCGGPPHSCPA